MAALAAAKTRNITPSNNGWAIMRVPVKATSQIYKGGVVGLASGYARAYVQSSGDIFVGIALEDALGGATDGVVFVDVVIEGFVWLAAITGSTGLGDLGDTVYASSDNDFTETSTNNVAIGKIVQYDAANLFGVFFQSSLVRSI
jgi:uncharacterized membrane protein (Fun14 family)